jgi:hypothetical protein
MNKKKKITTSTVLASYIAMLGGIMTLCQILTSVTKQGMRVLSFCRFIVLCVRRGFAAWHIADATRHSRGISNLICFRLVFQLLAFCLFFFQVFLRAGAAAAVVRTRRNDKSKSTAPHERNGKRIRKQCTIPQSDHGGGPSDDEPSGSGVAVGQTNANGHACLLLCCDGLPPLIDLANRTHVDPESGHK